MAGEVGAAMGSFIGLLTSKTTLIALAVIVAVGGVITLWNRIEEVGRLRGEVERWHTAYDALEIRAENDLADRDRAIAVLEQTVATLSEMKGVYNQIEGEISDAPETEDEAAVSDVLRTALERLRERKAGAVAGGPPPELDHPTEPVDVP